MYDIVYLMLLEFIDNLGWILGILFVFGFIGQSIRDVGGRR